MPRRKSLPSTADIWKGWTHLFSPCNFDEPELEHAALDPTALDPMQRSMLTALYSKISRDLLAVSPPHFALDKEGCKKLLIEVGSTAPPGMNFVIKRRFLEVIEAGNASGRFSIEIPYLAAPAPPSPGSPFQQADVMAMAQLRPMLLAFGDSLAIQYQLSPAEWWGRLLLSAMIHGGLLKTSFLIALPAAVKDAKADAEFRWLLLHPIDGKNKDGPIVPRRWFPDPLTRLLIVRDARQEIPEMPTLDRTTYGQLFKAIRAYARKAGFAELLPRGIRLILNGLETRLHYHLPPWLVAYATDRLSSTSLPEWVWRRLIEPPTEYVTALTPRERIRVAGPVADDDEDDEGEGDAQDQIEWPAQLRELGGLLNDRSDHLAERVQAWRDAAPTDRLPSVALMGEWVAERLLKKGRGRRPKKPRTVYQMVNSIGGRLVGQLGRIDLRNSENKSELAYVEIYQTALEDTPSINVRRKVARALRSLHEYLVAAYDAPPVAESGVFAVAGNGGSLVDANMISLDLFFRMLNGLRREAKTRYGEEMANELSLIASLGFFCGLRRSEAIGLSVGDVDVIGQIGGLKSEIDAWIEVSPNEMRDLKTRAGHRCLPTHLLMVSVELQKLLDWAKKRTTNDKNPQAPLFPSFVKGGKVFDKDERLGLITQALQHAADDETLRFHHLRHSFANWLLLHLWMAENGGTSILPAWFCPIEHDWNRFKGIEDLRQRLLGKAPTNRRSVLQVSALMGHSGLDITLNSYVHLADFILGRMVRRLTPELSVEALTVLSGYSAAHIQRVRSTVEFSGLNEYRQGAEIDAIADRVLLDGAHKNEIVKAAKVDFKCPPPVIPPKDGFAWMMHVAQALARLGLGKATRAEVAQASGLDPNQLSDWRKVLMKLPQGMLQLDGGRAMMASGEWRRVVELPAGPGQLTFAERTWTTLAHLYENGDPPQAKALAIQKRIDGLLNDFLVNWTPGSYLSIETDSVPKAKQWLWLLEKLKIAAAVVASHTASKGKDIPAAARQLVYWQNALDLKSLLNTEDKISEGTRGKVRIDIDLRKLNGEDTPYSKVTVLYGVRFVLAMMGCVVNGIL